MNGCSRICLFKAIIFNIFTSYKTIYITEQSTRKKRVRVSVWVIILRFSTPGLLSVKKGNRHKRQNSENRPWGRFSRCVVKVIDLSSFTLPASGLLLDHHRRWQTNIRPVNSAREK